MKRQRHQGGSNGPSSVLGLDFGKYLLSSDRKVTMDSDVTTGTESDTSDLEPGRWSTYLSENRTSENSEDSDDYQGYFDDRRRLPGVYDTNIDNADQTLTDPYHNQRGEKRHYEDEHDIKLRHAIAQLNAPVSNEGFGRPLYAIHETASLASESSRSEVSDSNSSTPIHGPVYGRYQKLANQNNQFSSSSNQESDDTEHLETLILHRLPGENLGMILGIEGGKDGSPNVSSVLVKSVTLGGAAYRATGSSKGVCVSDEILKVNGTDLRTLSHDECISVFKDMPLRVLLGIRRGEKNLPPVEISPNEAEIIDRKFDFQKSVRTGSHNGQDLSDSEDERMSGFAVYKVTIEKAPYENLGLSIVPSYGSTKEFYQIKRILPSGAAAHSGQLQVGDRLITCNGNSLQRLTQNHCLNILKSASSKGGVDLEVIRPLDNGSSMEISVTLNNNNTKIPGLHNSEFSEFDDTSSNTSAFDPSQYSLKSQSYDRHVDVIVTSESEDYLTLSEDDYSRTERQANITESAANEPFASNSFKLAYQKPFNAISEISSENDTLTETETEADNCEPEGGESESKLPQKQVDIVDLNVDSSPYHIPKKITSVHSPRTDIDAVSVDSSTSPRNESSDLDRYKSENSPVISSVATGSPYIHARQQVPESEEIEPHTETIQQSVIGQDNTETDHCHYPELNSGIVGIEFPEEHFLIGEDNTLYTEEDYELNESDKYFRPLSDSDTEIDAALPPPVEFSDTKTFTSGDLYEDNQDQVIPVSNIDDLTDSSSEGVSSVQEDIEFISSEQEYPEAELAKLEASLRDLEEASSDQPNNTLALAIVDEELETQQETNLPLSYEITVNSQNVPHEQEIYYTTDGHSLDKDFDVTVNNQSFSGKQNVPIELHESDDFLQVVNNIGEHNNSNNNSTMDTTSESVLKHALDLDYDRIPDSEKFHTRIVLGVHDQSEEAELNNANFMDQNIVAERIALEMVINEQTNSGYVESDEEPDKMPDEDLPANPPDLPDIPPPMLLNLDPAVKHDSVNTFKSGLNVRLSPTHAITNQTDSDILKVTHTPKQTALLDVVEKDSNWSFRVKIGPDVKGDNTIDSEQEIVPTRIERKSEFHLPFEQKGTGEISAPQPEVIIEPKATVTVQSVKARPPPVAPKPKPRKVVENKDLGKNVAVIELKHNDEYDNRNPVEEPIVEPTEVKKDKAKSALNVVKVISAFNNEATPTNKIVLNPVVKTKGRQSPPPIYDTVIVETKTNQQSNIYENPVEEPIVEATEVKKDKAKNALNVVKVINAFNNEATPSSKIVLNPVARAKGRQSPPPIHDTVIVETKSNPQRNVYENPVEEPIVEATEVKKDKTKNALNVVKVISAFNDGDKFGKQSETTPTSKIVLNPVARTKGRQSPPPMHDNVIVETKNIPQRNIYKNRELESPPPVQESFVEEKKTITQRDIFKNIDKSREQESPPPVQNSIVLEKETILPKKIDSNKDTDSLIMFDKSREHESLPPVQDKEVIEKQTLHKSPRDNVSVSKDVRRAEEDQKLNTINDEKDNKSPVTFKTQIKLTKDNVPKDQMTAEDKKVESDQNKSVFDNTDTEVNVPSVPRLNLSSIGSSSTGSLSPKSDKSGDSREKQIEPNMDKAHKTTIGVSKVDSSSKGVPPAAEVKQLSQIKPLSFNPQSLTMPRPVQYKTTINSLGSKPTGLSTLGRSSLHSTQKAEHPIKRMETLPFEVSILKGILGIGIKTQMTSEGLVQVTEILPSGPVGREGNIKVGDYLLSINNTELTGLPDSKVQQILRLLPRGLSKIVASAVPPEGGSTDVKATTEKKTLSPRTSVPLAAPRQPALTASQKSATLPSMRRQVNITSVKQPVISTKPPPLSSKSAASQSDQSQHKSESPSSPKSLSPALSPRKQSPPRKQQSPLASPRSPDKSISSPVVSPRKEDVGKSSPRSPPPISPRATQSPHASTRPPDKRDEQTVVSSKSLSPALSPRKYDEKSSAVSAAEPNIISRSPIASPRKESPREPVSPRSTDSGKSSPRTPPPVAPKPKKRAPHNDSSNTSSVKVEAQERKKNDVDESEPIETEIFASITGPKSEHIPSELTGPSIFPGAITYDYVPGKVDIVENTDSQTATEITLEPVKTPMHEAPIDLDIVETQHESPVHSDIVEPQHESPVQHGLPVVLDINENTDISVSLDKSNEQSDVQHNETIQSEIEQSIIEIEESDMNAKLPESKSTTDSDFHFRALEHIDDFVELVEPTKQRSLSVSSDSSYTDFNECNVEDESYLEEIAEENDTEGLKEKDILPEQNSAIENKDIVNEKTMECYRSVAEHIVANVISTVKEMDIYEANKDLDTINVEYSEFPTGEDEAPALPASDAPPLPSSPCPVTEAEKADSMVTDTLSSDDIINKTDSSDSYAALTSQTLVSDTIDKSQNTQLHAEIPTINIVPPVNISGNIDEADDGNLHDENFVYSQGIAEADEQGEYTDDFELDSSDNDEHRYTTDIKDDNSDDQSINAVISMYASIENSAVETTDTAVNVDTDFDKEIPRNIDGLRFADHHIIEDKGVINDETESVETKSLTSSDDVLSEGDLIENHNDSISELGMQPHIEKTPDESQKPDSHAAKINGFSMPSSKEGVTKCEKLKSDSNSDKANSSFSSDSAMSPARSGTPHSDDDREHDRGVHSPEVDRIIRLLSQSEPEHEGEGEIIQVKMNKGVTGVGFVIQGGKGSPKGDQPITIKRIFKGGPAEQCGQLQVNDEILDVNGEDLTNMRHSEAWQHLKFLQSGEISMTVRRFSSSASD